MKHSTIRHIRTLLKAGLTPMLQGPPGSGKTQSLESLAKELGWDFLPVVMSVMELVDVMGLPTVDKDKAKFLPFGIFEQIFNAKDDILVLLDDLGQACPSVQASVMQLIHGRVLNGHKVGDNVHFCIATNREQDHAGVGEIISPIRDRVQSLDWISTCTCDGTMLCPWHEWAIDNDIAPEVYAFARFRPTAMADWNAPGVDFNTNQCSARSLENLSKAEKEGIYDPVEPLIAALIGPTRAPEYIAFRTMYKALPMIDEILSNPETARLPNKLDEQFAVMGAISYLTSEREAPAAITYAKRLPREICMACVMSLARRLPKITKKKAYTQWATENAPHLIV